MTMTSVASLGEQLKTNCTGALEKTREVAEEIRDRVGSGYRVVERGIKNAKVATRDAIDDARHEIKRRPLTITTGAAVAGFAIGLLAGWIIGSQRE